MSALVAEAQHLALDLGWRVLPVKAHGKEPLTPHGVKDASADERTILHWWDKWPDANLGVATGAPGPTVLDIDDMARAAFLLPTLRNDDTPESATARGEHLFYAGNPTGTVSLGYGELRGRGSYVIVPPSIHPSGKEYVWLNAPHSRRLPPVPQALVADATTAGVGELAVREGLVAHGERHDWLKSVAVHLVRGGVTDTRTLARMLRVEYETNCETTPPARADEFDKIASWASSTRIAARERNRAEHREQQAPPARAFDAPGVQATLAEHRAFIHKLAGLPADVQIGDVRRFGSRPVDGMQVWLSTGTVLDFARQADVTMRGGWHRVLIGATSGAADPPGLKEPQLLALYRSLCLVAHTTPHATEAEAHADMLREFRALTEPVFGHTLASGASRFELIQALRAREHWDPFDRGTMASPAEVIDEHGDEHYLRAGELRDFFRFKGASLGTLEFPGRMAMAGLECRPIEGREPQPLDPSHGRRKARVTLYRVTEAAG
jgi:hypothetical protein